MLRPAWPHAPTHQLSQAGTFIVTASTYKKEHYFRGAERLAVFQRELLKVLADNQWHLEAWAVFSNHYHFIAHSPPSSTPENLSDCLRFLHAKLAAWVNRRDGSIDRKVWHNFWETRLTDQRSYLARLNYVHQNPVRHGLVPAANQYPWCSASFFERVASPSIVKSIYRFKIDKVSVLDDFETFGDW